MQTKLKGFSCFEFDNNWSFGKNINEHLAFASGTVSCETRWINEERESVYHVLHLTRVIYYATFYSLIASFHCWHFRCQCEDAGYAKLPTVRSVYGCLVVDFFFLFLFLSIFPLKINEFGRGRRRRRRRRCRYRH